MAEAVPASEAPRASRLDRRKAQTRQALIDAAVRLIAEGRGDRASIAEITEEADIGFGSFYNHFDSKEQLFQTASEEVLERWGQLIDRATVGISDPAERFAVGTRISGRLGWTHPDIAGFLTGAGLDALDIPGGLSGPDVAQSAWRQPAGRIHGLQADAGQEPGDIRMRPAQPPGDPQRDGEHLRRVADVRTGPVDHLPPLLQQLPGRRPEQLLLAVEVVVEGPEADVGLFGDLGDARALAAALGDQPHRGIDQGLPCPGLTPVQPVSSRRPACCCHIRHRRPPIFPGT